MGFRQVVREFLFLLLTYTIILCLFFGLRFMVYDFMAKPMHPLSGPWKGLSFPGARIGQGKPQGTL